MASLPSAAPPSPLRPERALLTPLWVGSLVLLVINDHLLKGAGVLPGVLTGKLSDFAGLIVAPVLLAALLRVRTREHLLACHVATGLVFAGIQLSIPFADLWSGLMGTIGFPWVITSDPTDLIALPMLLVSWRSLTPAMQRPALLGLQRTAVATLSLFGLWATVATSQEIDPSGEWYQDIEGEAYINNANEFDIALFVRELRSDIEIDCDEIAEQPGRLPDHAFGEAVHWVLPPRTNIGLAPTDELGSCRAFLVAGEGIPPVILFWQADELDRWWFPGQTFETASLHEQGVAVVFEDEGKPAKWVGGEQLRYTPTTTAPEVPQSCEMADASARIDWSTELPTWRALELQSKSYGVDGCFELELLDLGQDGELWTVYLCMPEAALPFVVGDHLRMNESGGEAGLTIELLNSQTNTPAIDDQGRYLLAVLLARGVASLNSLRAAIPGRAMAEVPSTTCPWLLDDGCATAELPIELQIATLDGTIGASEQPHVFIDDGSDPMSRELTVAYLRSRVLLDPICSDGADAAGLDLDFVVVTRPAP